MKPVNREHRPTEIRRDELDLQVREVNADQRTVQLSFSSEEPMPPWNEILSHDDGCVDLGRLRTIGVALYNHDRGAVVGRVLDATVDAVSRRGMATVQFDRDELSEYVWEKVQSGTLKGVSVGYRVDVWESVAAGKISTNGRFAGPCDVATRWTPYEISIVSVPADASVGVGRSLPESQAPADTPEGEPEQPNQERKENNMTEGMSPAVEGTAAPPDVGAISRDAQRAERERVIAITELCRTIGLDANPHISAGHSVDQVRAVALDYVIATRQPVEPSAATTERAAEVKDEWQDKFRRGGSDALLLRAGMTVKEPDAAAKDMRGMSLRVMMAEYLRLQGRSDAHKLEPEELIRAALLTPDSQFAGVLDDAANKAMLIGHQSADTTFQFWCGRGALTDFKTANAYRISEAGTLDLIPQGGEFTFAQLSDEKVSRALLTYGRKFGVTRQMIINDDLGYLQKMPAAFARAAIRGVNTAVYTILNGNSTIYDAKALFHNDHGNLAGTGAAISTGTVGAMRAAMMRQTDITGTASLNVEPRYLIVPPELDTVARQLIRSTADPEGLNSGVANPNEGRLNVITDAMLSDADAWFAAAGPLSVDTIQVDYLNGRDTPSLEMQPSWDILGREYRIYHDYAVTVLDYRGLYKNPGASGS
jgi:hypothetical protein